MALLLFGLAALTRVLLVLLLQLAQIAASDFARGRDRRFLDELDVARVFMR